jgi:hypothetical protein
MSQRAQFAVCPNRNLVFFVLQVFLVISILMGEGLYMVIKVLYSSKCVMSQQQQQQQQQQCSSAAVMQLNSSAAADA